MVLRTSSDPVTFENVTVLKRTDLSLACVIRGRTLMIGVGMLEPGSTVRDHDRGTLVLAHWRAAELGLLDPEPESSGGPTV